MSSQSESTSSIMIPNDNNNNNNEKKMELVKRFSPRLTLSQLDISPKQTNKLSSCNKGCIKCCSCCGCPDTACCNNFNVGCCCCCFSLCCETDNDEAVIYAIVDLDINGIEGQHVVQYWLPYTYNLGWPLCNSFCCCYCGFKENDFEHITIRVNDNGKNLTTYSAHSLDQYTKRETDFVSIEEADPLMSGPKANIGFGSHAIYPEGDDCCGMLVIRYLFFGSEITGPKKKLKNIFILQKTTSDFQNEHAVGDHPGWAEKFKEIRAQPDHGWLEFERVKRQTCCSRFWYPLTRLC